MVMINSRFLALGIGFEFDFYEFPEGDTVSDLSIRIQKENNVLSELVYIVDVSLLSGLPSSATGFQLATENVDFEFSTQTITFPVEDQFRNVTFRIIGDNIAEGAEAFALSVARNSGPNLLSPMIPETTIAIRDDDGKEEDIV